MNVTRIATVTMVCSALVAGSFASALAHKHEHDKPGHQQKVIQHHEHNYWWRYLYAKIEALTTSANGVATSLTNTLTTSLNNTLTAQLNDGLAAITAQLNAQFGGQLNSLNTGVTNGFSAVNGSLADLAARMATAEGKIATVEGNIAGLTSLTNSLNKTVNDLLNRPAGQGGGLTVVDSNGTRIGDFVGFDPFYVVPMVGISADSGPSFVLRVYPTYLGGNQVYFKDSVCTNVYVQAVLLDPDPANPTSPLAQAGVQDGVVYASSPLAQVEDLNPAYRLVNGSCQRELGGSVSAVQATWSMQLSTVPPYSVK
jgi:hypothetical protein